MCSRLRLTICPPFLPASLASSLLHSCATPCLWAARPPSLAISFCFPGSMAANPRLEDLLPPLSFSESLLLSFSESLLPLPEASPPILEISCCSWLSIEPNPRLDCSLPWFSSLSAITHYFLNG